MLLGVVLGVGAGYAYTRYQLPTYQASTKVLIIRAPEDRASELSYLNDQQLAETFTQLLVTRPILDETSERLGYSVRSSQINVQQVRDAQLIRVLVEDSDSSHAADIANMLVDVFLVQNEELQTSRFTSSEESLQAQIQQVEEQMVGLQEQVTQSSEENRDAQIQIVTDTIANIQAEILTLQEEIITLTHSGVPVQSTNDRGITIFITATPKIEERVLVAIKTDRLNELQNLLDIYQQIYVNLSLLTNGIGSESLRSSDQLQSALALYQQIYSNLLSNYESIRLARLQSTPNIIQVEKALPPGSPIRPNLITNIILGGIIGFVLAGGIAFLVEYLDDTFRTPDEIMHSLQLPILGYINDEPASRGKKSHNQKPLVVARPRSPFAEAFRTLRVNLEFAELDKPLKTLLITSPSLSDGKTTIAVNLALVIAQTGKRVVLVDADLRRPHVHDLLHISNRRGLSEVLREQASIESVARKWEDQSFSAITSGGLPPNPAEVLSSAKMAQTLEDLKNQYDVVIIDGPPFVLADASVLSARVDGVLIVIRANSTKASDALRMLDQLDRSGARVIGVTMNRIRRKSPYYYYKDLKDYKAFSYDYQDNIE